MLFNSRQIRRRWPALAVLLGASWLAAGAAAPAPSPAATPPAAPPPADTSPPAAPQAAAPAPAQASPSPAGGSAVADSDTRVARQLPELTAIVEEYRGLSFERPVPSRTISSAELAKRLAAGLHVGAVPAGHDTEALEISLKAFDLIPQSLSLADYLPKLMGSEIAGFYDSRKQELTLVSGPESLHGDAVAKRFGADMAGRMQEGLLVHELTHALQQQHFDLSRLAMSDPLSDPDAARLALVEGDATLVMLAEIASLKPDEIPLVSALLQKLLADPQLLAAMGAGVPGTAELAAAPAWIRETLLFSYLQGAGFCADVLGHGGQRLLDYAFRTDPPRSTKQILHPEKWYDQRDDPSVIPWPDLKAKLPGYVKAAEGQLGELGTRILLQEGLHDPPRGAAVAAGWGGDRFAVYRKTAPAQPTPLVIGARSRPSRHHGSAKAGNARGPERPLLSWITDWETDDDASSFAAAAAALGPDWWVERAAGRRVVVLRGNLGAAERSALTAALAAAPVEPAANRAIERGGRRPAAQDRSPRQAHGRPGGGAAPAGLVRSTGSRESPQRRPAHLQLSGDRPDAAPACQHDRLDHPDAAQSGDLADPRRAAARRIPCRHGRRGAQGGHLPRDDAAVPGAGLEVVDPRIRHARQPHRRGGR